MRKIIATFGLTLALTLAGASYYYSNIIEDAHKTISNLQQDQELKRAEIARLVDDVKSKDSKITEFQNLIENQKSEINRLNSELSYYDSLRQLDIVATAYTSDCKGCTGITATGYDVRNTEFKDGYRVVATDPRIIPMGSILYVEAEDRSFLAISSDKGGAIKGGKMDVLVASTDIANNFGRQDAKVTVIREGEG